MLKFSLRMYPGREWRWETDRWSDGASTIRPFVHPMLEHALVTDGISAFVLVCERDRRARRELSSAVNRVDVHTYQRLLGEAKSWRLDYVLLEFGAYAEYSITASPWGTAPIYLVETSDGLRGSWSLRDLLLPADDVDVLRDQNVARLLTHQSRYTRETLFQGIYLLTERARAAYGPEGLQLHYPAPAEHLAPRPIRDGVDVVDVYRQCLTEAVYARPFEPSESAVELSGGMDSAAVAMTLAEQHRGDILAYALAIGGEAGPQQMRRRAEMLRHLRFDDLTLDALGLVPLSPGGARQRGELVVPDAEPYHEAVGAILTAAGARGVRTSFTGDGGDELLSLRGTEWASVGKVQGRFADNQRVPPWLGPRTLDALGAVDADLAPQSVINEATLLGFALRSPQFLEAGIWPVSPLCDPQLIRFAEQLPVEWRDDKRICRERFRSLGLSEDVVRPHLRENFRHVMEKGLREYGIPLLKKLMNDAIVIDLGYVDGDALRTALADWERSVPIDTMVFPVLSLELTLRGLAHQSHDRQAFACT